MIIPVRCFQCGRVLADVWEPYQQRVEELKVDEPTVPFSRVADMTEKIQQQEKTPEATAMDELGVHRYCCRTVLLGTVDLTTKI